MVDDGVYITNSREGSILYEFATFICDMDLVAPVSDSQKYIVHDENEKGHSCVLRRVKILDTGSGVILIDAVTSVYHHGVWQWITMTTATLAFAF